MTKILGLTGSIGMGKSTVAGMLRDAHGAVVSDADAAVHWLLARSDEVIAEVVAAFPGISVDGVIDRRKLGAAVFGDDAAIKQLEAILHPRVQARHKELIAQARAKDAPLVVLEVPLLFETGGDAACDAVMVVTAPGFVQRRRVLTRAHMSEAKFVQIMARQMPDAVKRQRADYVIHTWPLISLTRWQVKRAIEGLLSS